MIHTIAGTPSIKLLTSLFISAALSNIIPCRAFQRMQLLS